MPTQGSARRVLSVSVGISAIFDVTGATVLRLVRRSLPAPPEPGSRPDPFRAAMDTIMAAHREVAPDARDEDNGGWAAPQALDESDAGWAARRALDEGDVSWAPLRARNECGDEAAPHARGKMGVTLPA